MGTKKLLNKITDIENQVISETIKKTVDSRVPKKILNEMKK